MSKKNLLYWLIVLALGVIGTVQFHLTQFSSRFDNFFGNRGDARLIVYTCEHWYQSFLGRASLLSPGSFYPIKGTLAYSDLLVGYAIPYSLLRALGMEMFSSLEIVIIGLNFLAYLACLVLLNKVLRFNLLASAAAAMFFAFNSPKFYQLGHLQLQFVLFLPLVFGFIISFARKAGTISQKRAAVYLSLAGIFLNLQLMTAFYHAWFFVLWSFLFLILALLFRTTRLWLLWVVKKYWPALLVSSAIFLAGFIPFLLVYLPTLSTGNWYSYSNVAEMIPAWWSLLSMGEGNYVWGWLTNVVRPEPWPLYSSELMVGIGLLTSLAWLFITFRAIRLIKRHSQLITSISPEPASNVRNAAPIFLGVMIVATSVFYLLGMKYWSGHSPWYFVYSAFPGAGAIRAMSRYVLFLTLPMSIGFAYVLDSAIRKIANLNHRTLKVASAFGMALLVCFALFEQFGVVKVWAKGFSKKIEMKYLKAMAGKLPDDCAAFYVVARPNDPHNSFEFQYDAMLISVMRGVPTLNGSSGQFPKDWFGLYVVMDPAYEDNVHKWIEQQNIKGKICRLRLYPPVDAFEQSDHDPTNENSLFVRQHVYDFLGREPTKQEHDRWVGRLHECQTNPGVCDRTDVSVELFHSTGFHDRGSFILRLYAAGLGRMPQYEEFKKEWRRLAELINSGNRDGKEKFVEDFMKSPEFTAHYEKLSAPEFAEKLSKNVEVRPVLTSLNENAGQNNRTQILLRFIESDEVAGKLSDRALVALHYFGYLNRDADPTGFASWLDVLKKTGDPKAVTAGFVNSNEYRQWF